ncbi:transglycosylase SLT domain-containing protein [Streptomyces sp. IBSBF 2435]|uniref:transglycosylase SLT domain-containing protein n=1 Tax=Streptomyces sp. IBSBF 2435 TaxID=2903531 RepID=UPI002FDC1376
MPGAFRIAEGYVEVTADQSAYDRSIDRLKNARHTVKVGLTLEREQDFTARLARITADRRLRVSLDVDSRVLDRLRLRDLTVTVKPLIPDAALRRVTAQLDRLTADRMVRILASVDTRVAADELRNLTARRRARIGVDVDTRVAADDLTNLTRRRTVSVVAQANTTEARTRLDVLTRDRRMNVHVDFDRSALSTLTSSLSSLGSAGGSGGGLGGLIGSLMSLKAAAILGSPAILGLSQAIVEMGPASALAVPAVLSLASAFAAIKIGTGGIGDAIKAALAPATSSGASATRSTNQVADAQRNLARAAQSAADSNRSAVQQVAGAERDLAQAQRSSLAAQQQVNAARKQAARDLQDLNNNLVDAQNGEKDAQFAVKDAAKDLADAQKTGDPDAIARAQLAYDEAVQSLVEQQQQVQRLSDDTKAANKAGVEGSDQVKQAKQAEADAVQDVADKTQALTNAQIQQARTAQAGADAILQAQEALTQAGASATSGTGAVNTFAQAMAKLAPAARGFVTAVVAQRAAWAALKLDVQQKLFSGLGASFTTMANAALPSLRAGLSGTAGVLNEMAKNAMSAVTNLGKTGTLRSLFDGLNGGLVPLSRIPGQFVTGLAQIGVAAAPAFQKLTEAAGRGADSISAKLTAAFKDGRLTKAIDDAVDLVKQLGPILANIGGILGSLFQAANTSGGGFLNTLKTITGALNTAFSSPAVQDALRALFSTFSLIAKTAGPLLITALETIVPVVTALGPPVQALVKGLGSALGPVIKALGPPLMAAAGAISALLTALNPVLPVVGQLVGALASALTPLLKAMGPLFASLAPILTTLVPPVELLARSLGAALTPIVAALGPVLVAVARAIGAAVTAVSPLLVVVGQMIAALGPVLTPVLGIVTGLFTALAPVVAQLGKSLLPPFMKIVQTLSGVFSDLGPVLGAALDQLGSQGLVPIVAALGTAIGGLVSRYAEQFVGMFQALLPVIPVLIPVVVQLAQSLAQILTAVAPLLPQVVLLSTQLLTQLLPAILPLLPVVADLATALIGLATGTITNVVMPVLGGLVAFMGGLLGALQPAIDAVTAVTKGIAAAFQWLFDVLVGHSIIPDLVTAIIGWFTLLWDRGKAIFDGLRRDVQQIWNNLTAGIRQAWNSFWSGLSGAITSARTWISGQFTSLRTSVTNTWNGLWNGVSSKFTSTVSSVRTSIGAFSSATKAVFTGLRDSLGTIWNGITEKFAGPVRFVISKVYGQGIEKMWNKIAGKISSKITLPDVPLGFAAGGVVPGKGTRDTVPAMLTPGERVLSLAQVAKLGGHPAIDQAVGSSRNSGPYYGIGGTIGGVVKGVGGAIGDAAGWAKDIVRGGLAKAAEAAIKELVNPLIARIPSGSGDFSRMIKSVPTSILDQMLGFLRDDDKKNTAGQINYSPVAGVAQWASTITQALGLLGQPGSWLGTVERRMNQESGGNPRAVNLWDSNAKAGHPSVGLMQVIRGTFDTYAGQFRGRGPSMYGVSTDPLANTYAGLNYALHRYGSLSALNRPGGYDQGGLLKPGATMAVNRTGRPEAVLNPADYASFQALVQNGGGVTIEAVNIAGSFDFTTPAARKHAAKELVREMNNELIRYNSSIKRPGVGR